MTPEGTQILTGRPEISFAVRDIQPPSMLYIDRNDQLQITTWATTTISGDGTVHLRILRPNGEIIPNVFPLRFVADRTAQVSGWELSEGFLLSAAVSAFPNTALLAQRAFVSLDLVRGSEATQIFARQLVGGYMSNRQNLSWPDQPVRNSLEGRGASRAILGTNPAAGVEIVETVPNGARWRLQAINFSLVTDATVINRSTDITIHDQGGVLMARFPSVVVQPASTTFEFTGAAGIDRVNSGNFVNYSMPVDFILEQGMDIRTQTTSLQAGDNYGAPNISVEEWLTGV